MMPATAHRLRVLEQHVASGPHRRRPPTQPPPKPAAASAPTPPPIAFLKGCRVIELANWIAAPAASAMLADFGADVIKVEPPAGDGMRYALTQVGVDDGEGGFRRQRGDERGQFVDMPFQQENRGKRSVAIALGTPQGQDLVHRLLESADVLVTNLLPDRLKRYGLDAETLEELNPRLIAQNPQYFSMVLIHELAHLIAAARHGRVKPHGKEWQQLMIAAGESPTVRHSMDASAFYSPRRRRAPSGIKLLRRIFKSMIK